MAKRPSVLPSVSPSLTPHRSIELLRQRLGDFDRITALHRDDAEVGKWVDTTEAILNGAFGKPNGEPHEMTRKFRNIDYFVRDHLNRMLQRKAVLESCIEQLEMLAPPTAQVAEGHYELHIEIERVSGDLLRDGYYKQAALEAYIRVIDEVKRRSGLNLDGDNLMNQAFGCDNRIPPLKFNSLSTDAEKDEQRAFLFFFKGIVGLRNAKALVVSNGRAAANWNRSLTFAIAVKLDFDPAPRGQRLRARAAMLSLAGSHPTRTRHASLETCRHYHCTQSSR